MKHKILGYIFLGLVFAAAVGAVYYWQNPKKNNVPAKTDETANWKTYRNVNQVLQTFKFTK